MTYLLARDDGSLLCCEHFASWIHIFTHLGR
jgi:hypothetical protein